MISLNKLTKSYGKKDNVFTALNNVSLSINDGETVAIVGKSGSGKSTLIHLLTGLDSPSSGDVQADKQSIFLGDTDTWRGQNVGIVFQQFFLQSNDKVIENVALPLKIQGVKRRERLVKAKEALEKVGLLEKARNKANDLSGGQKQRVAIARALVTEPRLLIADEPTGNLDSENGAVVENLLFTLNKQLGTTLVIVTHDEDLAARCDRTIRLKDGEVVFDSGAKKSLRKAKK